MSLAERVAHLEQEMDGTLRRHGTETAHQSTQVETVQELHHIVKRAILRHTEVVDLDRVWGSHRGRCSCLELEATDRGPLPLGGCPEDVRTDELDRGGATQQTMSCPPHLAHAATAEGSFQLVGSDSAFGMTPFAARGQRDHPPAEAALLGRAGRVLARVLAKSAASHLLRSSCLTSFSRFVPARRWPR
jgi:hypothetical protein